MDDNTLLNFIRGKGPMGHLGKGITSYIGTDDNNDKIHAECLELEKQRLIFRHLERGNYIVWGPVISFTERDVKKYLDDLINFWQEQFDSLEDNPSDEVVCNNITVARCYIDAYQSVRKNLFGELKE